MAKRRRPNLTKEVISQTLIHYLNTVAIEEFCEPNKGQVVYCYDTCYIYILSGHSSTGGLGSIPSRFFSCFFFFFFFLFFVCLLGGYRVHSNTWSREILV